MFFGCRIINIGSTGVQHLALDERLSRIYSKEEIASHMMTSSSKKSRARTSSTSASTSFGDLNGCIVLDNGGYRLKCGLATDETPLSVPNCVVRPKREKKVFVADQVDTDILDHSSLYYRRPIQKGYPVDWTLQHQIWQRVFGGKVLDAACDSHALLVTEPLFTPKPIQDSLDEIVFETFGFPYYCRRPAVTLAHQHVTPAASCMVLVECGYSFTHIVPMVNGEPVVQAVRRVNLGGKHLTNYLKEVISYRHWNMMDETHVINDIKEKLCYVSLDFTTELSAYQRREHPEQRVQYALPNGSTRLHGHVINENDDEQKVAARAAVVVEDDNDDGGGGGDDDGDQIQTLKLNNERICIPELLFRPTDIGLDQAGVGECVAHAIALCDAQYRGPMYSNIVVVGGGALFPNFQQRLTNEVRAWAPDSFTVNVQVSDDPINATWLGGAAFARDDSFESACVSKAEYDEYGVDICQQRFFNCSSASSGQYRQQQQADEEDDEE